MHLDSGFRAVRRPGMTGKPQMATISVSRNRPILEFARRNQHLVKHPWQRGINHGARSLVC
jgi:hypothetical protein